MIFTLFSSEAQLKKGNKMIGASIGSVFFNSGSTEVTYPAPTLGYQTFNSSFGLNIKPSVGWFISDNTITGMSININPAHQKIWYEVNGNKYREDITRSFAIGAGGFLRSYFKSQTSFVPFGQAGLNIGFNSIKTEGFLYNASDKSIYDGKSTGGFLIGGSISLGTTKFINSFIGLDFYGAYNFSYTKNTNISTTLIDLGNDGSIDQTEIREPTTKFTNHGFELGAGFQIFFERKK